MDQFACSCPLVKITSDLTKTTFYFITFYSHKYYLEARSQGGNGGKMTQCNTISKPDIMPPLCRGVCEHASPCGYAPFPYLEWEICLMYSIGLYRDVWIASSRKSLATQTVAICVRFQGRCVRQRTSQCKLRSLRPNPL